MGRENVARGDSLNEASSTVSTLGFPARTECRALPFMESVSAKWQTNGFRIHSFAVHPLPIHLIRVTSPTGPLAAAGRYKPPLRAILSHADEAKSVPHPVSWVLR